MIWLWEGILFHMDIIVWHIAKKWYSAVSPEPAKFIHTEVGSCVWVLFQLSVFDMKVLKYPLLCCLSKTSVSSGYSFKKAMKELNLTFIMPLIQSLSCNNHVSYAFIFPVLFWSVLRHLVSVLWITIKYADWLLLLDLNE